MISLVLLAGMGSFVESLTIFLHPQNHLLCKPAFLAFDFIELQSEENPGTLPVVNVVMEVYFVI